MSAGDPKSWLDQLAGAAIGILIASIALYCAVAPIQSILPFLIVAIGVTTIVGVFALVVFRTLRNRW